MSIIIIGSARIDERGKITGGKAGDQNGGKEVSTQKFYVHSKGWYILRPKSIEVAEKLAKAMKILCDNPNAGYDQNSRLDVVKYGIEYDKPFECDCSSAVRACIKWATGKDVGNFRTVDEVKFLEKSGLFEKHIAYKKQADLCNGDVLVTKTSGHTVIVVSGAKERRSNLPKFTVGTTYKILINNLTVRTGPGINNKAIPYKQLTANAKKHANAKGQLEKNTIVTIKAVTNIDEKEVWVRIPSGWICAFKDEKKYIGNK